MHPVFLNPTISAALDRIAERAADVRRAFVPGAVPRYDDVASASPHSEFTLDPLSVALAPDTYVACRTPDGKTAYTRDGQFTIDGDRLCTADGLPVLGFARPNRGLGELCVDPVDATLGRVADLRVASDGTLSYTRSAIDPRSGRSERQRVAVGRIAVARFPAATVLPAIDAKTYAAPDGVTPHLGMPADGGLPPLESMRRQHSGVALDESLARLKAAYVAFDALTAAETASGRFKKTVMDLVK